MCKLSSHFVSKPKYCDNLCVQFAKILIWFLQHTLTSGTYCIVQLELSFFVPPCSLQIQDPLVLLDPRCLTEGLLEWVPILERVLGPENPRSRERENEEIKEEKKSLEMEDDDPGSQACSAVPQDDRGVGCQSESEHTSNLLEEESLTDSNLSSTTLVTVSSVAIVAPVEYTLPADLQDDLSQLACLYMDLGCPGGAGDGGVERVCVFLRRFFFLLDRERVRKMCTLRYREQPDILNTYIACMLGEYFFIPASLSVHSHINQCAI